MADEVAEALYYIDGDGAGYDNRIKFTLDNDGSPVADLSSITRIVMFLGSVTVDSDVDVGAFDWQSEQDSSGNDLVVVDLEGKITAPMVGFASLITYDAVNTDGIVWFASRRIEGQKRLRIRCVTVAAAA